MCLAMMLAAGLLVILTWPLGWSHETRGEIPGVCWLRKQKGFRDEMKRAESWTFGRDLTTVICLNNSMPLVFVFDCKQRMYTQHMFKQRKKKRPKIFKKHPAPVPKGSNKKCFTLPGENSVSSRSVGSNRDLPISGPPQGGVGLLGTRDRLLWSTSSDDAQVGREWGGGLVPGMDAFGLGLFR